MRAIDAFRDELTRSAAEFPQRHPHPFLVYAGGPLRGLASGCSNHFMAAPIAPRDPAEKVVTIGVSSTCDIVVNDGSLSKQHAWFERASDGRWQVWDNDSVAGTQVNGELIKPGYPRTLASDDKLTLGYVELSFLSPDAFYLLIRYLLVTLTV